MSALFHHASARFLLAVIDSALLHECFVDKFEDFVGVVHAADHGGFDILMDHPRCRAVFPCLANSLEFTFLGLSFPGLVAGFGLLPLFNLDSLRHIYFYLFN